MSEDLREQVQGAIKEVLFRKLQIAMFVGRPIDKTLPVTAELRVPDNMVVVDRDELMELLRECIRRGRRLLRADADYVEWLESLEEEDE
jgi:hypothetical protein